MAPSTRKRQRSPSPPGAPSTSATMASSSTGIQTRPALKKARLESPQSLEEQEDQREEAQVEIKLEENDGALANEDDETETVGTEPPEVVAVGKRKRIATPDTESSKRPRVVAPPPLLTIPLEILFEILLQTHSLPSVLALSLTCTQLCKNIAKGREAEYVWRETRVSDESKSVGKGGKHETVGGVDWRNIVGDEDALGEYFRIYSLFGGDSLITEQQWARFMLGAGVCEMCDKDTKRPFVSFALRIRLCENRQCETAFVASGKLVKIDRVAAADGTILPTLEDRDTLKGLDGMTLHQNTSLSNGSVKLTRKNLQTAVKALVKEKNAKELDKMKAVHAKWMQVCRDLVNLRRHTREIFYLNKAENEKRGKAMAEEFGFDFDDMMNCTDYGPYHRGQNHVIESIGRVDVQVLFPTIQDQLERLFDKRDRRTQEIIYQETRKQILEHYKYLTNLAFNPAAAGKGKKIASPGADVVGLGSVLPSLASFRDLPVIEMLQETAAAGANALLAAAATPVNKKKPEKKANDPASIVHVAKSLKTDAALMAMLKTQIGAWVDKARGELGAIAKVLEEGGDKPKGGRKGGRSTATAKWKSVNKNEVHPVERMSVRFRCIKCKGVGAGLEKQQERYEDEGCLDFKGACAHDCYRGKKLQWKWAPGNFERDEKASAVVKRYLELTNIDEKKAICEDMVKALEPATFVVCTSCPCPIVMKFGNLIGHSHRHEDMQFHIISTPPGENLVGKFPYESVDQTRLLKQSNMKATREMKIYGCRVCYMTTRNLWVEERRIAKEKEAEAQTAAQSANGGAMAVEGEVEGEATDEAEAKEEEQEPMPPLFSFDGLRSHLKAKHTTEDVRDEDFFIAMMAPVAAVVNP